MADRADLFHRMREALAECYPQVSLAKLLASDAGLDLAAIDFTGPAVVCWQDMLSEADRKGRIDELLDLAIEQAPARADLAALREEYLALNMAEQAKRTSTPTVREPEPSQPAGTSASPVLEPWQQAATTAEGAARRAPRLWWLWSATGLLALAVVVVLVTREMSIGTPTPAPTEALQVAAMLTSTSAPQAAPPTERLPDPTATPASTTTAAVALADAATATEAPTATPAPGATANGPNDMTLVYVPKGGFRMGSAQWSTVADQNEMPENVVYVDGFWISRTEVTNAQYARCVEADVCLAPTNEEYKKPELANRPVANVSWSDAQLYTSWIGGRLPTEAEWEKACRGTDARSYPWGDDKPTNERLNHNLSVGVATTDVGSYPQGASPYGVLDMAGNVYEWTNSLLKDYLYKADDGREAASASGTRVVRGGAFFDDAWGVRCARRIPYASEVRGQDVGFRVVASPVHP